MASTRKGGAGSRASATSAPKSLSAAQRKAIANLQNEVRNAINFSLGGVHKLGVEASDIKASMRRRGIDLSGITVRAERMQLSVPAEWEESYSLSRNGELLFRLRLVRWEGGSDARWHVKRHPDATWWRTPKTGRKPGGGQVARGRARR